MPAALTVLKSEEWSISLQMTS